MVAQLKAHIRGDQAAIAAAQTQLDYTTITSACGLSGDRAPRSGQARRQTELTEDQKREVPRPGPAVGAHMKR